MSNRGEGSLGSTDKPPANAASTADLDMRDRYPKKNDSLAKLINEEGWSPNGF